MKAMLSFFLILFFSITSALTFASGQAKKQGNEAMDYCYKPTKLLFLASTEYKQRYDEDMKEYQRCRQGFMDMQARVASMKKESEKNARLMQENFIIRHY